jgi:hypothetical protein
LPGLPIALWITGKPSDKFKQHMQQQGIFLSEEVGRIKPLINCKKYMTQR